ncbi:alpha/beta hydrolase [Planctomicrobium sp. SH664]|uniref:alpha/beta hydrolase n=1 Tax=Planctomicrobium sp. SH664 TaxID=3448125 RepID=UPI003F5CBA58
MRRCLALCLLALNGFLTGSVDAALPEPIPLWPQGAPGAVGTDADDQPCLYLFPVPAETSTGTTVIVFPGGGYRHLAMQHEGEDVARWLNTFGVTAVVLKYRLSPKYRHPSPLQDAQQAVRYVRANAEKLQINGARVGVWGFSAGGHLAATLSTHFDNGQPDSSDVLARQSCRPDFAILSYPVISFGEDFTHSGSRKNLLGETPDPELVKSLSNETQVTADTPPTFLFHTSADKGVPPQNSIAYYLALHKNGVPVEMHIYEPGKHGLGLAPNDEHLNAWKDRLAAWLKLHGWLTKS